MQRRMRVIAAAVALALPLTVSAGCGGTSDQGPSLQDIPRYPNAIAGESMQQSSPGGFMSGSLAQFTTTDSFDEVVGFYSDALSEYDTEKMNHTSELGRQTAISIRKKSGMLTVAIQEFTEEGEVNITFMAVGG